MHTRRMFFLLSALSLLLVFLAGFNSCKNETAPEDGNQDVYPDSNLSYSQHIRPIFLSDCSSSIASCHQSAARAGGLDLEVDPPNFQGNNGPVVVPYVANQSLLYILLFGPDPLTGVGRMPPPEYSSSLSEAKIKAIGTWINEGAIPVR